VTLKARRLQLRRAIGRDCNSFATHKLRCQWDGGARPARLSTALPWRLGFASARGGGYALYLNLLAAHGFMHGFDAVGTGLAHNDFFGDVRGLAYDGLFGGLRDVQMRLQTKKNVNFIPF
jgi:hypothetical protein